METTILWTGIEYYSLENCIVNSKEDSVSIDSVIIGSYENKIYRVDYHIETNQFWQTYLCEVKAQLDDKIEIVNIRSEGERSWSLNGKHSPEFDGCTEVDIPLTPFTNSLPINRLNLKPTEERLIKVIYIDILADQIRAVNQKYLRLSEEAYKYENVPNDFEAVIKVDRQGLVIDYPQLFVRTSIATTNH